MTRRRLVITADDLGLDAPTNAALTDLLAESRISATSLIVVAPGAADAGERIRARGLPPPHLHATLTSPRELPPYRPAAPDVPSLVRADGTFPVDAALLRAAGPEDVRRELRAQVARARELGVAPRVMDSHSGTLYDLREPSLTEVALEVCAEEDLAFRLPRRLHAVFQGVLGARVRRRHRAFRTLADALGVRLPATILTCWLPPRAVVCYAQLRALYLLQLAALPRGTSELFLHPAPPETTRRLEPAAGRLRGWELRLLRDPVFGRALARARIDVVETW